MSQINTNGINTNYPVPGQNNSSQGFRDNFAQIRTNLNTAGNEITDLQNKAVLKSALNDIVINNDMGNTLISNASTRGFRATTYNLGNSISGTTLVDVNRADTQYGTITADTWLQFGNWAPTNTESNVVLRLTVANVDAKVYLPNACVSSNNNFGVTVLENYANVGGVAALTAPANVEIVELNFSTIDCGNTISVSPTNRPYQATQIITRSPPPTGIPGDVAGTVAVDADYIYVCTDAFDSTIYAKAVGNTFSTGNKVQLSTTNNVVADAPIVFTGNLDTANTNLVANTVYYVKTIVDVDTPLGNITISDTRSGGTAGATFVVGNKANLTASANIYVGTDIWKRVALDTW